MVEIIVREGKPQDLPFLREMLFEAAFWRPDAVRPPRHVGLSHPEIAKLLEGWGREGDTSMIAETAGGRPVGAAWYRFWSDCDHSYGYVSADIPELGIAVIHGLRRSGIGDRLLHALGNLATECGIERLSLSVEEDNPARHMYVIAWLRTGRHSWKRVDHDSPHKRLTRYWSGRPTRYAWCPSQCRLGVGRRSALPEFQLYYYAAPRV